MPSMSQIEDLTYKNSLPVIQRTTNVNGAGVDSGVEGYSRTALLDIGAHASGSNVFTFEESDDDSVWAALGADKLNEKEGLLVGASVTISDDTQDGNLIPVTLLTIKQFTRVVQGSSGADIVAGAHIITGNLRYSGREAQPMSAQGFKRTKPTI